MNFTELVPSNLRTRFRRPWFAVSLCLLQLACWTSSATIAQDNTDHDIAQTAATAQNNSSYDFAAQQWEKLITNFPKSPLASKAHYNAGICYLQSNEFEKSIDHFQASLPFLSDDQSAQKPQASLYLGFAQFRRGQQLKRESKSADSNTLLTTATQTLENLLISHPDFKDADQVCYFQGGAFEELDRLEDALKSYMRMRGYPKQTFNLEGLYAIADMHDQLGQHSKALEYYKKFQSESETDNPLANEVKFRTGRTMISLALADENAGDKNAAMEKFKQAAEILANVANQDPAGKDQPFVEIIEDARFQQAFCARRLGQFETAAILYEKIASNPKSRLRARALTYAGQNFVDARKTEKAIVALEKAVNTDSDYAKEAAHWLAGIYLKNKSPEKAYMLASMWAEKSADHPMLIPLLMDQADAAYAIPSHLKESAELFKAIAENHPDDPLAPSALYNSAFASLKLKDYKSAITKADRFESKYQESDFLPDTLEIKADACLLDEQPELANQVFNQLATQFADHEKNSLWKVRSGLALYLQMKYQPAINQLKPLVATFSDPAKKAETLHWIGSSQFHLKDYANATKSLSDSLASSDNWKRADETLLTLCRAQLATDQGGQSAQSTAQRLIKEFPNSPLISDVYYHIGEQAYDAGKFETAYQNFDQILQHHTDSKFVPFSLYNAGWSQLKLKKFAESEKLFSRLIKEFPDHELAKQAKIGRGATRRKTGDVKSSIADLKEFLQTNPTEESRINAMYEIGLAQVELKQWPDAIETFNQLIAQSPDSPRADRYYYELGWAYRSSGKEKTALDFFTKLKTEKPESPLAAEANFHVGSADYAAGKFDEAINAYSICVNSETAGHIREKAAYKLAWAHYKQNRFQESHDWFSKQVELFPNGDLYADGLFMVAESQYRLKDYANAFHAYSNAKPAVDQAENVEPKIKWLTMVHGAQSANKIKKYQEAIELATQLGDSEADISFKQDGWLEMGTAYRGLKQFDESLKHYRKAAENLGKTGARAHCMIGDLYFKDKKFEDAANEFKLVFFGFGGPKAEDDVKPWQAYAVYEAARSSFVQIDGAPPAAKPKLIAEAKKQFEYLLKNYGNDRLAPEAKKQLEILRKMDAG